MDVFVLLLFFPFPAPVPAVFLVLFAVSMFAGPARVAPLACDVARVILLAGLDGAVLSFAPPRPVITSRTCFYLYGPPDPTDYAPILAKNARVRVRRWWWFSPERSSYPFCLRVREYTCARVGYAVLKYTDLTSSRIAADARGGRRLRCPPRARLIVEYAIDIVPAPATYAMVR